MVVVVLRSAASRNFSLLDRHAATNLIVPCDDRSGTLRLKPFVYPARDEECALYGGAGADNGSRRPLVRP